MVWMLISQLAVAYALGFFNTEALGFVNFVVTIGTFKEEYGAVTLKGENVGADAVEKPAVVTDDYGASRESLKAFLQGAERVHVNIVRRLVKQ